MPRKLLSLCCLLLFCFMASAAFAQPTVREVTANDLFKIRWDDRGKVLVFNFWATWCGPCKREIPHLKQLRADYPEGKLSLVAISVDEDAGMLDRFLRQKPLPYTVVRAIQDASAPFQVSSIPKTIVYNRVGKQTAVFVGLVDYATLKNAVDSLISK